MSTHTISATQDEATESPWSSLPLTLAAIGLVMCIYGYVAEGPKQFAHSYLAAFMFFLSIGLGSWFLVLMHHLFDAGWSSPIRRYLEHLACLLPKMAALFLPIAFLAPQLYGWMSPEGQDHSWSVKQVLFNPKTFFIVSAALFAIWGLWTHKMRGWSLRQDETGSPECMYALRRWAAPGIFVFAFSLTAAAIFWMKSIEHQWFSTMYGVYYFAGSVWLSIATAYVIGLAMKQTGRLPMLHRLQFHHLGTLLLAFTVFYAYIHFSQYFLQWNAAIPEETFWYVRRDQGMWAIVGWTLIIGHFLIPFLVLLRIDVKLTRTIMIPVVVWVWLMHYMDMQFNVMPLLHPQGPNPEISDLGTLLFIGGTLTWLFLRDFNSHPPCPQKDPRMHEAIEHH